MPGDAGLDFHGAGGGVKGVVFVGALVDGLELAHQHDGVEAEGAGQPGADFGDAGADGGPAHQPVALVAARPRCVAGILGGMGGVALEHEILAERLLAGAQGFVGDGGPRRFLLGVPGVVDDDEVYSMSITRLLNGYRLTTAEIIYHRPDHPALLQSYVWQDQDMAPRFPVLMRSLRFWEDNLDGRLHTVRVAGTELVRPAQFRWTGTGGLLQLH